MPYSRNFGMRSFENVVRHGRAKTPATLPSAASTIGSLLLGTAVQVDPANPGVLKVPAAASAPTALSGVLVYEHIQYQGVDTNLTSPQDAPFNSAPLGRYVQVMHGQGAKVWFKNTADKTLYDGRLQKGYTLVAGVGGATPTVQVGDMLTPAADGTWQETATASLAWMVVENVDHTNALVECRLTF